MLVSANSISGQTVVQETFGSTAVPIANNYSGATSTPSVNYVTNVAGYTSVDQLETHRKPKCSIEESAELFILAETR